MLGAGMKMATIQNKPPTARCLDLTRLVSRIGRGSLTGIDRVELAYLSHFLCDPAPLYSLVKFRKFQFLLSPASTQALADLILAGQTNSSALTRRKQRSKNWRLAYWLWAQSLCAAKSSQMARKLRLHLPEGTAYINTGHSNLAPNTFQALKKIRGMHITVLVHDCIPLDYAQYQRVGTPERFKAKMQAVSQYADFVIFNSKDSKDTTEPHFHAFGRVPPSVIALLGIAPNWQLTAPISAPINIEQPYFVTVGTIEPRKNHALLLDIWAKLASHPHPPKLVIVGKRGWNNQTVFDRLDRSPANIVELNNVSDTDLNALLDRAAGALFPSLAEGFGFPPAEAALRGVPVICGDLPVYKEFLGDYPVYADTADMYLWETTIQKLVNRQQNADNKPADAKSPISLPTWEKHFNLVLKWT